MLYTGQQSTLTRQHNVITVLVVVVVKCLAATIAVSFHTVPVQDSCALPINFLVFQLSERWRGGVGGGGGQKITSIKGILLINSYRLYRRADRFMTTYRVSTSDTSREGVGTYS